MRTKTPSAIEYGMSHLCGDNNCKSRSGIWRIRKAAVLRAFWVLCLLGACRESLNADVTAVARTLGPMAAVSEASETEYQIKAAFIYNFMKFTEWPAEKEEALKKEFSAKGKHPMVIGIVGENRFGKSFVPIQEKTIRDHPIQVVEFPSFQEFCKKYASLEEALERYSKAHLEQMRKSHVLYISESEKAVIGHLQPLLAKAGVLTISDLPRFIDEGGVIGFKKENNKIRFEVSLIESERQKLRISSQLLKLAIRVKKEG